MGEAYLVSTVCGALNEPRLVLIASLLTIGVTLSLTLFALTTKQVITNYHWLFC
jgi:hypothetical protein